MGKGFDLSPYNPESRKEYTVMIKWNNMDTLSAYDALKSSKPIHLSAEMAGDNGAKRSLRFLSIVCFCASYSRVEKCLMVRTI